MEAPVFALLLTSLAGIVLLILGGILLLLPLLNWQINLRRRTGVARA
jgi:hypothetical protein